MYAHKIKENNGPSMKEDIFYKDTSNALKEMQEGKFFKCWRRFVDEHFEGLYF
jgi:hypothetical protein